MSAKYDAAVAALSSNEELRKKVMTATSAEERAGHLRDHGLDLPTHEEINSRHSDLADVTGAGNHRYENRVTPARDGGGGRCVGCALSPRSACETESIKVDPNAIASETGR